MRIMMVLLTALFVWPSVLCAADKVVYESISIDETVKLLSDNGMKAVKTNKEGEVFVTAAVNDFPFCVNFHNCNGEKECHNLSFILGIEKESNTLALVNGWNQKATMSSAYLVDHGAVLELDVVLTGGATRDHLEFQLNMCRMISEKFVQVIKSGSR